MRSIQAVTLAVMMAGPVAGAQFGAPLTDGEIRTTRDTFTNDTTTSLMLVLRGPQGQLPINVVFARTRKGGTAARGAGSLRIEFDLRVFVGIPDYRTPHLKLILDGGTKDELMVALSAEPTTPLRVATHATLPVEESTLVSLAQAKTAIGSILGEYFELSPAQLRAIKEFARMR